ncbi:MAG: LPS-assembly protein LptD [Candidatus Omnitrophica bacterium]|nr:LPS-assembly protein LptD [Candidatus Omnitrophota bacterium]
MPGGIRKVFESGMVVAVLALMIAGMGAFEAAAQVEPTLVEINGDRVDFSMTDDKVIAEGNVSVERGGVKLLCDRVEFYNQTKIAIAEGNVVLINEEGQVSGNRLKFNFDTMKGKFEDADIFSDPFYGSGESIDKVGEEQIRMERGYLTTCDHDKPHFKFLSRKIDVYPGEKAIARHVRLIVGKLPIMYIPRFTQNLKDKKPVLLMTPGYDKDWGAFLLTRWRHPLNDNVTMTLHADYRERKDFASGVDVDYRTTDYGSGMVRTYFMNERALVAKHFYEEQLEPTPERERYKIEWRHKWQATEKTSMVGQYYQLSDPAFLKDYFERQHDQDQDPSTYFLLTHALKKGTLSLRSDVRINRFVAMVERLPEISYNFPNHELWETGVYLKSTTTYSNLIKKNASPSADKKETTRVHADNELSYPMKVSFLEVRPFVGSKHTYYRRTKEPSGYDSIRGAFRTGTDISTKFYRVFEAETDRFGLDINMLRHIISPSVAYQYVHDPTIPSENLDAFDGIDSISRSHGLTFSLENKLQTKRDGASVDLARLLLTSDFKLKEDPGKGGFNDIKTDLEIRPYDWVFFNFDSNFNTITRRCETANVDLRLNDGDDDWYLILGKRYNRDVDDQLTSEWGYRINQKWAFRMYQRFDLETGTNKEQEYSVVRDMHAWELEINFNETCGEGSEIWLVFTLKDFPDIGFDFSTRFNRRKPGSQNSL